jgi:hypothetical protein
LNVHLYKNTKDETLESSPIQEKEDTTTLKETINQLQGDIEKLVSELSVQGNLTKTKDEQITNLRKQLDHNNGSA